MDSQSRARQTVRIKRSDSFKSLLLVRRTPLEHNQDAHASYSFTVLGRRSAEIFFLPPTRPDSSGRVPGLFFGAKTRKRQRGWALAGASRVAKGRGGVDHTARSNHRLSRNSALKKADSLRNFLLKKVAKNGSLHIIQKPSAMNRPPMKRTSLTDGGAAGRPTTYPSREFETGDFHDAPDQRAGTRNFCCPIPVPILRNWFLAFFSAPKPESDKGGGR